MIKTNGHGPHLSFQPFAARKHKEIHRINNATSTWHKFDDGLKKATRAWESNQYPPAFYKPVVRETMLKMMESENTNNLNTSWRPAVNRTTREKPVFCFLVPWKRIRSKREETARVHHNNCVYNQKKLKSVRSSLKSPVHKMLASRVVYQIECPGCNACNVGQFGVIWSNGLLNMPEHRHLLAKSLGILCPYPDKHPSKLAWLTGVKISENCSHSGSIYKPGAPGGLPKKRIPSAFTHDQVVVVYFCYSANIGL